MMQKIKQLVATNLPLKLLSLLCGYLVWSMISQSHVTTITQSVPICVYNNEQHQQVSAPESIAVTLQAVRSKLSTVNIDELALHLDASRLHKGPNQLLVDRSTLFLPEGVNVVHYSPSNSVINVTEKI